MNILVLTPYFPAFDIYKERSEDPRTKFLYDYAVEWVKSGHNVVVLHTIPKYPAFFPWVVRMVESVPYGQKFQLNRFVQNQSTLRHSVYVANKIRIIRIPVSKYIPHYDYLSGNIRALLRNVDASLQSINWCPDLIFSDFLSPSLAVACHVGSQIAKPVFQIFHQSDLWYLRSSRRVMLDRLQKTSVSLFRSYSMKTEFEQAGWHAKHHDYMFSGIPSGTELGVCRREVARFLYVGSLRYSKNIHGVIKAFAASCIDGRCRLEIVGSGPDESEIKKLPRSLGIERYVTFLGKVSRDTVFERMRRSDCLVMVSKETFGMVYVEAMSQGCIVIAAKGQGIDGIVVDGENGFLVSLEDTNALAETMHNVSRLNGKEAARLSKNAISTAAGMTDDVLANRLLEMLKPNAGIGK